MPTAECAFLLRRIKEEESRLQRYLERIPQAASLEEREELVRDIERTQERLNVLREEAITTGCMGPPFPPPPAKLRISHVEHTQATQTRTTNSVPLVAGKDTVLRVYVDHPHTPGTVTGTLFSPAHPTELGERLNGPIVGRRYAEINRAEIDHTLNFRLPASACFGDVQCTLAVSDPAHPHDESYSDNSEFVLRFSNVPKLRVWAYLVHYTGPDMAGNPADINSPTVAALRNTMKFVQRVYPTADINYLVAQEMDVDADMRQGVTACGAGWDAILDQLKGLRTWAQILGGLAGQQWVGSHDVFVALVPAGVPSFCPSGCVVGCGGGGAAAGYEGDGPTLAQEIGHALRREHAPGCSAPNADADYPAVGPVGSIVEDGFDVAENSVMDRATTFDFMSYCGPQWVSPYTYTALLDSLRAQTGGIDLLRRRARGHDHAFLYLTFQLHRDGKVTLGPSFHVVGPGATLDDRPLANVTLDLVGENDEILVFHRCHVEPAYYDADLPLVSYNEVLPWYPNLSEIVFRRDGQEIFRLPVEPKAPEVKKLAVDRLPDGETIRLTWDPVSVSGDRRAFYGVLYSSDDGQSWRPLAFGLTQPTYDVKVTEIPGGKRCRFRILASAGIRTATADTEPLSVPIKDVAAFIESPATGTARTAGEPVMLEGGAFSPDAGTTQPEDLVWISDVDGRIGTGTRISTDKLSVGRHRITLSPHDPNGREIAAQTVVVIKPNGQ